MTQANRARRGHSGQGSRRVARVAGGIAFVLTPWVSLGLGTPVAFLVAAALFSYLGKAHAVVLWTSTAVYTAVLIVEVATSDAAPDTTGERVFVVCLVITMVVGGLQALAYTVVAAVKGYRPAWGGAVRDAAVDVGPEVRGLGHAARQSRGHLSLARAIRQGVPRKCTYPEGREGAELRGTKTADSIPAGAHIVVAGVFFALGVALCVTGINERGISADLDRRGVPAAATVVAVTHSSISSLYGPQRERTDVTVAFTDARGTARRATQEGLDSTQVGDRLQILYDPQEPTHVRWDTAIDETALDLGFGVISGACALGMILWFARRYPPSTWLVRTSRGRRGLTGTSPGAPS